jgi:hypothetical protein
MRTLDITLQVILGLGALAGGGALVLAPDGSLLGMPLATLDGTPFGSFLVPGLILFWVLGVAPLVSATLGVARRPIAPLTTVVVGVALVIWISVQVLMIGYGHPIQPIYLVLGIGIAVTGLLWWRAGAARAGWTPRAQQS